MALKRAKPVPSLLVTARHALQDGHVMTDEERRTLLVVLDELDRTRTPQGFREPRHGWQRGFCELLRQHICPWCGHRVMNVSIDDRDGITWACYDGCNP